HLSARQIHFRSTISRAGTLTDRDPAVTTHCKQVQLTLSPIAINTPIVRSHQIRRVVLVLEFNMGPHLQINVIQIRTDTGTDTTGGVVIVNDVLFGASPVSACMTAILM